MNRALRRIGALALSLVMCFALIPAAGAIEASGADGVTAAVIDVNLIMDSGVSVPKTTFAFELTTGAVAAPAFPLFNGSLSGVKIGKADDMREATTYTLAFAQTTVTPGLPGGAAPTAGSQYATEQLTVDFSGVTFKEPGVYRYKLTETAPAAPFSLYAEEKGVRYIDVYVEYATDDAADLTIQGIIVLTGNADVNTDDQTGGTPNVTAGQKSGQINNAYATHSLELEKQVAGNQASQNRHFTFQVTVTNPTTAGVTYSATYAVTKTCQDRDVTNPETVTAGAPATFSLKDGEKIVIRNLPMGATYTVVETPEDYIATATVNGADCQDADTDDGTFTVKAEKGMTADTRVVYTNTRNGLIPTGVLLTVVPFAALMVIGLVGVLVILRKRHNK